MGTNLFDSVEADRLKEEGMKLAAENRADLLDYAKSMARALAQENGTVTVDDVYLWMKTFDYPFEFLGPAAGSIFKGKSWEFTGEWRKSTRTTNHGRYVRVWKLRAP